MTKKEYLYELYESKLITREEVPETEKDLENVYKIHIQDETGSCLKYVKYDMGELSDDEINIIIQLRQTSTLKSINGILIFFLVVFLIGVVATVFPILSTL